MNSAIAGSSVANVLTVLLFGVANCIRKRLNKSKCESHCYIFDCEAQLDDLKQVKSEVVTQRGLLQNLVSLLDSKTPSLDTETAIPQLVIKIPPARGRELEPDD